MKRHETEERKEYMRDYYAQNSDAICAASKRNREARQAGGWVRTQSAKEKETQHDRRRVKITENPMYFVFHGAKARAKKLGIDFSISLADIPMPTHCPVLGIPLVPAGNVKGARHGATPNSPSIDRIDSSEGYVPGNVWVISCLANQRKNDQSARQILELGMRLRLALAARGYVETDA